MKPLRLVRQILLSSLVISCSQTSYKKTVPRVERDRFMGKWYVLAGRFTAFEKGVHNATEFYTWNQAQERIDIEFKYNKGSLNGPVKEIPQKGWIVDTQTNATWKVSPFWPLKFGYLIIALDPNYQWTAIGVPDQAYLWIMARSPQLPRTEVDRIIETLRSEGYDTKDIVFVPHNPIP